MSIENAVVNKPTYKEHVNLEQNVIHPAHYNNHPSGIECIEIIQWMPANVAFAMKHLWRLDEKHPDPIEDLQKAKQYIEFEIKRRKLIKDREV